MVAPSSTFPARGCVGSAIGRFVCMRSVFSSEDPSALVCRGSRSRQASLRGSDLRPGSARHVTDCARYGPFVNFFSLRGTRISVRVPCWRTSPVVRSTVVVRVFVSCLSSHHADSKAWIPRASTSDGRAVVPWRDRPCLRTDLRQRCGGGAQGAGAWSRASAVVQTFSHWFLATSASSTGKSISIW